MLSNNYLFDQFSEASMFGEYPPPPHILDQFPLPLSPPNFLSESWGQQNFFPDPTESWGQPRFDTPSNIGIDASGPFNTNVCIYKKKILCQTALVGLQTTKKKP